MGVCAARLINNWQKVIFCFVAFVKVDRFSGVGLKLGSSWGLLKAAVLMASLLSPSVAHTEAQSSTQNEKVAFPSSALFPFHKNDAASHNFSPFHSFFTSAAPSLPPSAASR